MIDRTRVPRGVLCALLGYVIPLPLVGRLFHWRAVLLLKEERRELALLQPLLLLMTAADVERVALLLGTGSVLADLSRRVPFLQLLAVSAELYFHYQFLGELAVLAEVYQRNSQWEVPGWWQRSSFPLGLLVTGGLLARIALKGKVGIWAGVLLTVLILLQQYYGAVLPCEELGRYIRGRRTVYILLITAMLLVNYMPKAGLIAIFFQVTAVILIICVMFSIALGLFRLWRCARTLEKV